MTSQKPKTTHFGSLQIGDHFVFLGEYLQRGMFDNPEVPIMRVKVSPQLYIESKMLEHGKIPKERLKYITRKTSANQIVIKYTKISIKNMGEFGNHRMYLGSSELIEHRCGGRYKSKLLKCKQFDVDDHRAFLSQSQRDSKDTPTVSYILKGHRANTLKRVPKYSASLMHRCKTKKR